MDRLATETLRCEPMCEPPCVADEPVETLYKIAKEVMEKCEKTNKLLETRIQQYIYGRGEVAGTPKKEAVTSVNKIEAIKICLNLTGQELDFICNFIEDKLVKELKKL